MKLTWITTFTLLLGGNLAEPVFADRVNPFAKPASVELIVGESSAGSPATSNLELKGLLQAGDESMANINGQLVSLGEGLNGYTLVSVGDGLAKLRRGEQEVTLTLSSEDAP